MAKLTHLQFTAGLISAALAFRQQAEQEADLARLKAVAGTDENDDPPTLDEEDLWEHFQNFVEANGIPNALPNPDALCFAALKEGEPSFTLRGQDILASMLTRHWIALFEGLAPRAPYAKIQEAEGIAEKMEMYHKQRWAD